MKHTRKPPLLIVVGSAAVSVLTAATPAQADGNPFQLTELSAGYMQFAAADTVQSVSAGVKKSAGDEKKSTSGDSKKSNHASEIIRAPEGTCGGSPLKAGQGACGNMGKNKKKKH